MKRVFVKTAFVLTVFWVWLMLLIPVTLLQYAFLPVFRDRLPMGVIVQGICLCIVDRSISSFFRLARLTDERWSIFKSRGRC